HAPSLILRLSGLIALPNIGGQPFHVRNMQQKPRLKSQHLFELYQKLIGWRISHLARLDRGKIWFRKTNFAADIVERKIELLSAISNYLP
ncbi:MAG TPA: hypothetical protein VIJ25_07325, partial [Methylococcales bacterium]